MHVICAAFIQQHGRLTCARHRRRVRECSVVAVLTVTAPGAFAVIEAMYRTAGALKVLRGRLVETPTTCCAEGSEKKTLNQKHSVEVWRSAGYFLHKLMNAFPVQNLRKRSERS